MLLQACCLKRLIPNEAVLGFRVYGSEGTSHYYSFCNVSVVKLSSKLFKAPFLYELDISAHSWYCLRFAPDHIFVG